MPDTETIKCSACMRDTPFEDIYLDTCVECLGTTPGWTPEKAREAATWINSQG